MLEIQRELNRNPARDKTPINGCQSLIDSQGGRMSLKNSKSGSSVSAKTTTKSSAGFGTTSMPAMPAMKSLMFKEEESTIGFWPGCQAPDLKEVPSFVLSLIFLPHHS